MKTLSLVQTNFPVSLNQDTFYLPYSAALIWSYINSFANNEFELNKIIFRREPIEQTAIALAKDTVVGFSCYMWSRNYSLKVAKRIKELNPSVIIVFGGPEMEIEKIDFFQRYPFIDAHVIQEGEIAFKAVLDNLKNLEAVPGIIYNDLGKTKRTSVAKRIMELDTLPSPYLNGVFDKILRDNPEFKFVTTLESNRGCPYACTFCDWGSLTYSKIRKFSLERVFKEIEWTLHNKQIEAIDIADANFGIFEQRDSAIVDKIIEEQNKAGRTIAFGTNYAKNQNATVVQMVKKLAENTDSTRFHTVSLQTLNEVVLETIKRKNLAVNKIKEVFSICSQNELNLKIELILGLPDDTLEGFKETFYKLYDISPEISVQTYRLLGLNNSELFLISQGGVEWRTIKSFIPNNVDDIEETFKWVYSTNTMTNDDILEALVFASWITAMHSHGFTNLVSYYAVQKGMSYKEFYEGFLAICKQTKYFSDYFSAYKKWNSEWYDTGSASIEPLNGVDFSANNNMWHFVAKIHNDEAFNIIFDVIKKYMKNIGMYDKQIMDIQRQVPIGFNSQEDYPLIKYYNNKQIKIINLNSPVNDKKIFINSIYFKRERGFAKGNIVGLENLNA
jgi:radical SAM superfamily enzyme YgiQ (UPF0313 family)